MTGSTDGIRRLNPKRLNSLFYFLAKNSLPYMKGYKPKTSNGKTYRRYIMKYRITDNGRKADMDRIAEWNEYIREYSDNMTEDYNYDDMYEMVNRYEFNRRWEGMRIIGEA